MPPLNLHLHLAQTAWQEVTAPPPLPVGTVHVWRVPLRVENERAAALHVALSAEEKERFSRFRFPKDREAHTVARGRLRQVLGSYLNRPPAGVTFAYAAAGKPFLADHPALRFNLSHAGDWALIACSRNVEVGADVEAVDRSFAKAGLVDRYFSRQEIPVLLGLPEADRHRAFFLAWIRKEAIIKARGGGLQLPLDRFGVSIRDGEPVRVLHTDWQPAEARNWQLRSFTVAEGYFGAVAWLGEAQNLNFLQ